MLEGMQIHFVRRVEDALDIALGKFDPIVRQPVGGGSRGENRPAAGPVH
jgi:hypothetical protein